MAAPGSLVTIAQDEILTGEAVALDVQPVGFFLRAVGVLIDMVASVLLLLGVVWFLDRVGGNLWDSSLAPIVLISTIVLVWVVLPTAVETFSRGRSLGKLAVGSRIVRLDGGAAGFRHAFIRSLTGVFELWMTLGAVAAMVAMFTPRAQRLGDLLAGTYAERTRAQPLPLPAAPLPPELTGWAEIADVGRLPDRLARRALHFVRIAPQLDPTSRLRNAEAICTEVRAYVSPVPDVHPEVFLRGVVAIRRERDAASLAGQSERVASLTAGTDAPPAGFPQR